MRNRRGWAWLVVVALGPGAAFGEGPGGPWDAVAVDRDIPYAATKNPRQTLDVIRPKAPRGDRLPAVVNVHGGAFLGGDKRMGADAVAALAASGDYVGVSIHYRLSGEALWPAQIHDCKAAIRWVRANAPKYGIDPEKIGVIGESAGGHLVAMLGTSGDVASLDGDVGPHAGTSSRVQAVVDEFGPTDFLTMNEDAGKVGRMDHEAANSPESRLLGGPIRENPGRVREASSLTYITKDDPPFLILHGDRDPLVGYGQSVRLAKALKDAGVTVTFVTIEGAGHGGFRSPEVPRRIRQFLDKSLRGRDEAVSDAPIPDDRPRP